MINGHKQHVSGTELPVSSHTAVGLLVLALSLGGGLYLVGNYNPDSRTLAIAGSSLQLTEVEDDDHGRGHDDDHEEDDD